MSIGEGRFRCAGARASPSAPINDAEHQGLERTALRAPIDRLETSAWYDCRVKRLFRSIIICLLIGALINVLVAWGIALAVNPLTGDHGGGLRPTDGYQWDVSTTTGFGTLQLSSRRHDTRTGYTNTAPGDSIPHWSDYDEPLPGYRPGPGWDEYRTCQARGWPMLSLRTHTEALRSPDGPLREQVFAWSLRFPWGKWKLYPFNDTKRKPLKHDIYLPLRPIWSGFVFNTLIYAAPVWIVMFGFAMMRRRRRNRHGACPDCGYPRGASDICTECGKHFAHSNDPQR